LVVLGVEGSDAVSREMGVPGFERFTDRVEERVECGLCLRGEVSGVRLARSDDLDIAPGKILLGLGA
jgi:hypothetical protein